MSRLLVDPAIQGYESRKRLPQCRGGLLTPLAARWTSGDCLRGSSLEVSTLGTLHLGWCRGGGSFRPRVGRSHLPGKRRQGDVAEENPRDLDGVLPH